MNKLEKALEILTSNCISMQMAHFFFCIYIRNKTNYSSIKRAYDTVIDLQFISKKSVTVINYLPYLLGLLPSVFQSEKKAF